MQCRVTLVLRHAQPEASFPGPWAGLPIDPEAGPEPAPEAGLPRGGRAESLPSRATLRPPPG
jgi:hypothetical protein